jgi:hypothetical protein
VRPFVTGEVGSRFSAFGRVWKMPSPNRFAGA